jgi:hypothetical protein
MLDLWRSELNKALEFSANPEVEPMSIKDLKNLIEARQTIDTMGRRVSGLPMTFQAPKEDEKSQLPYGMSLILPNAIQTDSDEAYEDDEEDYDYGETS